MCSESKAFSLSGEDRSDDQILSCLPVEPLSAANRGGILHSVMSAMCHSLLPTASDKKPTDVQPREIAKKVNKEMWS